MAGSDEIRKRLEALNRGPLESPGPAEDADDGEALRNRLRDSLRQRSGAASRPPAGRGGREPIVLRRTVSRRSPSRPPRAYSSRPHVALEQAVEGVEAPGPDGSAVWLVQRRVGQGDEAASSLSAGLADALADAASPLWAQLRQIGIEERIGPDQMLFFDLETTGLGSSPLFLIGAMTWDTDGLLVRQFFARDYSEERAALGLFLELAGPKRLLVSFNGKSFDLPFVRVRSAANGVACRLDPAHLDLLHVARRTWGGRLPDCRLQTLERIICGRVRRDDIPGHLIPDAYHDYVHTGNAAAMVTVLEHNYLDLLTVADLLTRLPGAK